MKLGCVGNRSGNIKGYSVCEEGYIVGVIFASWEVGPPGFSMYPIEIGV